MNYWLTTHWPPYEGEPSEQVVGGVWIPDGRESAGSGFAIGDIVFIYHPKSGRTLIETSTDGSERLRRCQVGREGIVGVGVATGMFISLDDTVPERYTDGSSTWWRWYAPVKLRSRSGFVPRKSVVVALGYKENYNLRGLGEKHSGLKKLSQKEGEILLQKFRNSTPISPPKNIQSGTDRQFGGSGEGPEHLVLKEYVAANPSRIMEEKEVTTFAVERSFPTGDRADIVLRDKFGMLIGVEVEVVVSAGDIIGALQAVKYRRMLEMLMHIEQDDCRAVLVAYTIAADVKEICERYDVKCIEVPKKKVVSWKNSQ